MSEWFIKQDRFFSREDQELHSWTITTDPEYCGWETDSGHEKYGLPKELAQWICDRLNECGQEPPYKTTWHTEWKKNGH